MASTAENKQLSHQAGIEMTFEKSVPNNEEGQTEFPNTKSVILIMIALYLAIFLVALDRTIISTAIPRITDDFHSLGDVGWYGSAYMFTGCSFLLLFGRIYTFYPTKWVFLTAIGLFEIGSTISGSAPNSTAFIVGRAIAGLGSSGVFSGAIVIMVGYPGLIPLSPALKTCDNNSSSSQTSSVSRILRRHFRIASVVGPLLGGAFTDKVSWRWCFYINLPIGAMTVLVLIFILKPFSPKNAGTTIAQQITQLDPIGNLFFLPGIICALLVLQWGGSTYSWNDERIIGLLVVFGILIIAFIVAQVWNKENATVPARIITQQIIIAGIIFSACTGASQTVLIYYLPIWFQAIKSVSAIESEIMLLPMIFSLVAASIFAGALISAIGYYTPFMFSASILMSVGEGLVTIFQRDTDHARWIGYQTIYGFGVGLGMQQPGIAAQTVLPKEDVPTGVALMYFAQSLSGAIFASVAQNVFANCLVSGLTNITGLDPHVVVSTGATDLGNDVAAGLLDTVLSVYNTALTKAYTVALAMTCLSIVRASVMEWKSVKTRKGVANADTSVVFAKGSNVSEVDVGE